MTEKAKLVLEVIVGFLSLVAVAISVYALKAQKDLGHETATQTLIHDQYALCRVLDQMRVEFPETSHVLALPAQSGDNVWKNYHLFKAGVRKLLVKDGGAATDSDRAKLYLQEHAVALHVFDIYEQTMYQHSLAEEAGDKARAGVLSMLVEYYEKRMLRNPRLRFHWDNGGSDMMETSTRDRYDEKVRKAFPTDKPDDTSPLDDVNRTGFMNATLSNQAGQPAPR
jgi:hypothetical protein